MSDRWETYLCQIDNNVGSILFDFGIRDSAPLSDLSELTWLCLYIDKVRADGFPESSEFEQLNKVDDAIDEIVSIATGDICYVGRATSNGRRTYFFYGTISSLTEKSLASALSAYPKYRFDLGSKSEPEWNTYFEYLFPDARQYQTISNGHVLQALEEHGDRLAVEREVDHWAYFENSFDRARFIEAVCERDFRIVEELNDTENEPSYGVHLTCTHAVDRNTIDAVTLQLFDCAHEHSGQYDGWETVIVK
jgi:uncharacterized protein (TIGR01619 family)